MITHDERYLDTLYSIRNTGKQRSDRTGVGTIGVFGVQQTYDLRETFPLLTSKKMDLRAVSSELLWFIEGSGDERRLAEIRYGKPREDLVDKTTIWTANARAPYWEKKARFDGDLGRVYGVQWRKWRNSFNETTDQLADLIKGLQDDPYSRRHILLSWNPGELYQMALPPCHMMAQFYVQGGELSCLMTQRSADYFLGSPFNIASYSMLTMMIAQVCGLKPGSFIYSMGDTHLYQNHFEAVDQQLEQNSTGSPPSGKLIIDPTIKSIDEFRMSSFVMEDYNPLPAIRAPMAV